MMSQELKHKLEVNLDRLRKNLDFLMRRQEANDREINRALEQILIARRSITSLDKLGNYKLTSQDQTVDFK
jgi:hypothetical protein